MRAGAFKPPRSHASHQSIIERKPMPSWNIHAAITKKILESNKPKHLGIYDTNAFKFGNLLPDVYVGYMVKDITHTLRYIQTHLTEPEHIPIPGADTFWNTFCEPYITSGGVSCMILGAWAHLQTDAVFNKAVRAFNAAHDIAPGNETRIKKQADFHLFGNSLNMDISIDPTPRLLEEAAKFPHYAIDAPDVRAAIAAFEEAKRKSITEPMTNNYLLLSRDFLDSTLQNATNVVAERLKEYAHEVANFGWNVASPSQISAAEKNLEESAAHDRPILDIGPAPEILFKDDPDRASIEYEIAHMKAQTKAHAEDESMVEDADKDVQRP